MSYTHISSHMIKHFKDFDSSLGEIIADLCEEFDLADDAFGYGLKRIHGYPKEPRQSEFRIQAFMKQITELKEGTYIFIDHPATPSCELDATSHNGYEDVTADRKSCLETLLSDSVKQRIRELEIELINYSGI